MDRFKKAIKSSPQIIYGFYVTGDADFISYVSARSMEVYEEFTQGFFMKSPTLRVSDASRHLSRNRPVVLPW
ncbi:Lrp/AsnC ligand binding domain-containing protein [Mesorhizobium sp.]|uniref:Lrp/AsnC ligand binding domain-containing protein n=1 Tax=Mesorhizobium sp. TaxID=1871066 RepID=UPI0025796BA9|nr:Lrp/AsnC ligand binding domain-containing protein [Mesorhizobium sp.]